MADLLRRFVNGQRLLYGQKGLIEPARRKFYDFKGKRLFLEELPEVMKMFHTMYETKTKQLAEQEARENSY